MKLQLSHPQEKLSFPDFPITFKKETPADYIPSRELAAAVNVAIALGQPILLTGEPGTGKTSLAFYLAHQFGLGAPIVFDAQTMSAKKDLFYHYDALGHFHWSQVNRDKIENLTKEDFEKRLNLIRYEGLGKAIYLAKNFGKQSVVLIDEIDKASRDLPNDLLTAIENLHFEVPEIPGKEKTEYSCPENLRPIIVITSNSEKNLPDAFLRRVVYFHIKVPESIELLEILKVRTESLSEIDIDNLVAYFMKIREAKNLNKNPATAELISWATLLAKFNFPTNKLSDTSQLSESEREILRLSNSVLVKTREDLNTLNVTLELKNH